jgi:methionyl-tRNA synthetase
MNPNKPFFITTSIPYLNGVPHLGHALEYVQSDVVARYRRTHGAGVYFLTGSDEHGAKIARAAESANQEPQSFVDEKVGAFLKLLRLLQISNDDFIRTSNQDRHWPGAQLLWKKLSDAGDIYKGSYKGLYCIGHEAFITEKDMEGGLCAIHKAKPETIEEENYFFALSRYKERIKEAIHRGDMVIMPESRRNEALMMVEEAGDISFSRPSKDIPWGIPVPGDASNTMYVWCDALTNYISALGFGTKDDERFKMYWPADVQVIGKDILRFHAVIWPAMLMSAGLPPPKRLFVHGWINVKGDKMSKSLGNVVDPMALVDQYGTDAVRFYLMNEVATFGDGDYSSEQFERVYEGVLAKGIGNVVSRTAKMISLVGGTSRPNEVALNRFPIRALLEGITADNTAVNLENTTPSLFVEEVALPAYEKAMEEYRLGDGLHEVMALLHILERYIEDYKIYKAIKDNPEEGKILLWHVAYSLLVASNMLDPFIPTTAEAIRSTFGITDRNPSAWQDIHVDSIPHLFASLQKKTLA